MPPETPTTDVAAEIARFIEGLRQTFIVSGRLDAAASSAAEAIVTFARVTAASAGPVIDAAKPLAILAMRTTTLTSSIYGAEKAFTSLVPILSGISTSFQTLMNFSAAGREAGFTGRALNAAMAGAGLAVRRFEGIMTFQLDGAQKVTDTFISLSSSGATFGASINNMAMFASELQVPIQMMGKVIQANIEQISNLGSTMERNAQAVFHNTRQIFHNVKGDQKLNNAALALYGTYENLAEGVTGFLALQKQQGINIMDTNYQQDLTNGTVQEYLIRLKELQSLTGKSVKTLQAEETERRTNLAYQQTINQLGEKVATNFAAVESVAGRLGPEIKGIARSLFAGQELTAEQRQIAAMNQPVVDMIERMVGASKNLDPEIFKTEFARIGREAAPEIKSFVESLGDIAKLPPGVNQAIDVMTRIGAAGNTIATDLLNLGKTMGLVQVDTQDAVKGLDPATQTFVRTTRTLLASQTEIDTAIVNNMQKMNGVTDILASLQTQVLRLQYAVTSAVLDNLQRGPTPTGQMSANAIVEAMAQSIRSSLGNAAQLFEDIPQVEALRDRIAREEARISRQRSADRLSSTNQQIGSPPIPTPSLPAAAGPRGAPVPPLPSPPGSSPNEPGPGTAAPPATPPGPTSSAAPATGQNSVLAALDLNNRISGEQQELLADILRVQNNILSAVS